MPKTLPNAWQLVIDSWQLFLKTWNESIRVSIWFLYFGLVYFAAYLLLHFVPSLTALGGLIELAVLIFWSLTMIRLIQACFRLTEGKDVDVSQKAFQQSWSLLLPLLWVGLLQLFVLLGSGAPFALWDALTPIWIPVSPVVKHVVGVALLVPICYVGVRLSFVPFIAIDRGTKGLAALAQSSDMVRNRWWAFFSRQFVACLLFGILLWFIASIIFLLLGLIVGPEKFILLIDSSTTDPLLRGITALMEGMLQAVFMPLFVLFFVKLYKSTKGA